MIFGNTYIPGGNLPVMNGDLLIVTGDLPGDLILVSPTYTGMSCWYLVNRLQPLYKLVGYVP